MFIEFIRQRNNKTAGRLWNIAENSTPQSLTNYEVADYLNESCKNGERTFSGGSVQDKSRTAAIIQKMVQLLGPAMKSYDAYIRPLVVSRFCITL